MTRKNFLKNVAIGIAAMMGAVGLATRGRAPALPHPLRDSVTRTGEHEWTLTFAVVHLAEFTSDVLNRWQSNMLAAVTPVWPGANVLVATKGSGGFDPWTRKHYCSVLGPSEPTDEALYAIEATLLPKQPAEKEIEYMVWRFGYPQNWTDAQVAEHKEKRRLGIKVPAPR